QFLTSSAGAEFHLLRLLRRLAGCRSKQRLTGRVTCSRKKADTFLVKHRLDFGKRNPTAGILMNSGTETTAARINHTMTETLEAIRDLDDLRALVHKTLCDRENILQDQFSLTETALIRGGNDCGMHFWVQGPRSVRLEAIWVADRNTLYFYDARGV